MNSCLIEVDDLVVTVSGDLILKEFDDKLIKHCLISGLTAPAEYTIARILAEDWGHDARQVLGLSLRHRDGSYTKTGGKVIKNVSGYDLSKIYLGTCELFAEIQSASLRLEKCPSQSCKFYLNHDCDLRSLIFFHKLATMDFDNSFDIEIVLPGQIIMSFSAMSDELSLLKQERLRQRLIEFFGAKLDYKLETKPYIKKYPSVDLRFEYHTVLTNLLAVAKSLNQPCSIFPKRGYVLFQGTAPIKLQDCYCYVYPKTQENQLVEQELNDNDNDELDLLEQLKREFA